MLFTTLMLIIAVLIKGGVSDDDVEVKAFTTGSLAPGFALIDDDSDSGGLCLKLEKSFELASLNTDQCDIGTPVEMSERNLNTDGWTVVRVDDDTASLVHTDKAITGADSLLIKFDGDGDDGVRYSLALDGYQFVGGSTDNYYVLELSFGLCGNSLVDHASKENKKSASTSTSTSTSKDKSTDASTDESTSTDISTSTSTSQETSTSKETSTKADSSKQINGRASADTLSAIRTFLRSIQTTRTCGVNGNQVTTKVTNIVCMAQSLARYRIIVQNFQGCNIEQSPDNALNVRTIIDQEYGASNQAFKVQSIVAVVVAVFMFIIQ